MANGTVDAMVNGRANRRTKGKHKPPSRIRYEATHPTISMRLSEAMRQRADRIREMSGKSFLEIFSDGVTKSEPLVKQSYERGYKKGWEKAKDEHGFCWRCGTRTNDVGTLCYTCIIEADEYVLGPQIQEMLEEEESSS